MKRLAYLLTACILLTACDIESSDNGSLDGYWQLRQLDTLATGGTADMHESGIYWSVGFDLLEIRDLHDYYHAPLFRFSHEGDRLTIHSPYFNNREVGDERVDDPELLHRFGIYHLEETFTIEQLDKNHLRLHNEHFRFHLRKY